MEHMPTCPAILRSKWNCLHTVWKEQGKRGKRRKTKSLYIASYYIHVVRSYHGDTHLIFDLCRSSYMTIVNGLSYMTYIISVGYRPKPITRIMAF